MRIHIPCEMNTNNDYQCYIRRHGHPWTLAQPHHRVAMERFLEEEKQASTESNGIYRIIVPHTDGGEFIGWFRRLNPIVCQYMDEYGHQVSIMMSSSSQASFAHRIVETVSNPHL